MFTRLHPARLPRPEPLRVLRASAVSFPGHLARPRPSATSANRGREPIMSHDQIRTCRLAPVPRRLRGPLLQPVRLGRPRRPRAQRRLAFPASDGRRGHRTRRRAGRRRGHGARRARSGPLPAPTPPGAPPACPAPSTRTCGRTPSSPTRSPAPTSRSSSGSAGGTGSTPPRSASRPSSSGTATSSWSSMAWTRTPTCA